MRLVGRTFTLGATKSSSVTVGAASRICWFEARSSLMHGAVLGSDERLGNRSDAGRIISHASGL
jgi:hypothetical protein